MVKANEDITGSIYIEELNDDGLVWFGKDTCRLFNRTKYKFINTIHEEVVRIDNEKCRNKSLEIVVRHIGYCESVLVEKRKGDRNIELLKEELKRDGTNPYYLGHLGTSYKMNGEYEKAIECYEKMVFNEQCVNESYYTTFVDDYLKTLIKLGEFQVAMLCENLWKHCGHDDCFVHLMGLVYLGIGLHEKALECFLECVNKEGQMVADKCYSYYMLGEMFEHFQEYE